MSKVEDELKEYGLFIRENDSPKRELVDFSIEDGEIGVAWVWAHSPNDVDWECKHPYQCIEFGDGSEQGECVLCGSYCDYHYEEDDRGNKVPEPNDWYLRRTPGGLIGKYLEELRAENE